MYLTVLFTISKHKITMKHNKYLPTSTILLLFIVCFCNVQFTSSFNLVLMGARRGKGNLKKALDTSIGDDTTTTAAVSSPRPTTAAVTNVASLNRGKGQEITGVTLPAPGQLKGWEFGEGQRLVCANTSSPKSSSSSSNKNMYRFAALQGDCPRCAFDLWKGDLIIDDPAWDEPCIACPTCSTTYSLSTGEPGPPLKRKGLQGFVGNLAKSATSASASKKAKVFRITREEDTGRVFLREK